MQWWVPQCYVHSSNECYGFLPADRSPLRSLFGRPFRSGTPIPTDSHSSSDSSTESEPSSDDDNDSFPNMEEDDIMASMDAEQWATPEDDWY